jgi:hypothetical protein
MPIRWHVLVQLAWSLAAAALEVNNESRGIGTGLASRSFRDGAWDEPVASNNSRRQRAPALVVVLTEIDDPGACQLLSMLSADGAMPAIPVVTLVTSLERSAFAELIAMLYAD